jgi:protein-S-isoprenylcysteine O-methyltransferase Ste14
MNGQEIVVLICVWLIVFSGVYVNVTRRAAPADRTEKSLVWFRILAPLALVLSIIFYYSGIGTFPSTSTSTSTLTFTGTSLFVLGMILRWIAIISLGKSFTVQVAVKADQPLKTNGVFRYIRHPSYTGLLLYNIGLGLVMQNWISLLLLFILPLIAVLNRIAFEEKILNNHFGESYSSYSAVSKKLIPWLY